jgi:protein TonB
MRLRRRSERLYVWLALSLVLHSFLLALPASLIELVFPPKPQEVFTAPADLTPDFEAIAISLISVGGEVMPQTFEPTPAEEDQPAVLGPPRPPGAGPGSTERGGGGDSGRLADTRFFPPVPRLIIPPEIDNLGVSALNVDIRILVGADGFPVEVDIPDSLVDSEIGKRLLESAARFRFEPARQGDLPVASWISLPLQLQTSRTR